MVSDPVVRSRSPGNWEQFMETSVDDFFPLDYFFHGFPATVCVVFPYSSADFLNVKKIRSPIERWIVSINLDEDGGWFSNYDAKDFVVVV